MSKNSKKNSSQIHNHRPDPSFLWLELELIKPKKNLEFLINLGSFFRKEKSKNRGKQKLKKAKNQTTNILN